MVKNSGTPTRAHQLRPLNSPKPLTVTTSLGGPLAMRDGGEIVEIESIQDCWAIDDEWWRDPIRRRYFRVLTARGAVRTIYHDVVRGGWFEQAY
jgi:hypothetical protein